MDRRRFVASAGVGLFAIRAASVVAQRDRPPMPSPDGYTGTPVTDLQVYSGDMIDLWVQPWKADGMAFDFHATILQRSVAGEGEGFTAGDDGLVFRSLIHMELVPKGNHPLDPMDLMVATNDDLGTIAGRFTAHVVGVYAGKAEVLNAIGNSVSIPLVVASLIEPSSGAR